MIDTPRIIKNILMISLSATALLVLVLSYFLFMAPRSGAAPTGERLMRINLSENYERESFQNTVPTVVGGQGASAMASSIYSWLFDGSQRIPQSTLLGDNSHEYIGRDYHNTDTTVAVTWFGHSTVLIGIENKRVLFDPMFSETSAPIPYFGKRFPVDVRFSIDSIPMLDAIVISHDHFDHLDLESVTQLASKCERFFVPLGVGAHLESWGILGEKITELDWWESLEFADLTFTATPARHFSGRSLPAENKTLWASWVVAGAQVRVFFSGDSGYFPGFKEIGDRLGPFDLCMVECGQYSESWPDVHMAPEQTVLAHKDLRGALLMPIHWGAFDLSLHSWDEPPRRMLAASEKEDIQVALPKIGQTFRTDNPPQEHWWEQSNGTKTE